MMSLDLDPVLTHTSLRYVTDSPSWWRRRSEGEQTQFLTAEGQVIADGTVLQRVENLKIPPNWHDVLICPDPNGHIQAVGRDQKGRKQYRYHDHWQTFRQRQKFATLVDFARALPDLRSQIHSDMKLPGLPRNKVLATVVWLMEHTFIRVGNAEYARKNNSYGATTIRDKHVEVGDREVTFTFTGKSGVEHEIMIDHPRVARIIKKCRDLPGYELFQYLDHAGHKQDVGSAHVNEYIRSIMGADISAKDFRTWGGTVLSATTLHTLGDPECEKERKKNIVQSVKEVAQHLGNRPATCRKYYIHPTVIATYEEKQLIPHFEDVFQEQPQLPQNFQIEEEAVVRLIQR